MGRQLIAGLLILALIALPIGTRISSAGGGGGCSGEDEGECLAVVFGTAAAIIIITLLVTLYVNKGPKSQTAPASGAGFVSFDPRVTLSEDEQAAEPLGGVRDWIVPNGEAVVFRW